MRFAVWLRNFLSSLLGSRLLAHLEAENRRLLLEKEQLTAAFRAELEQQRGKLDRYELLLFTRAGLVEQPQTRRPVPNFKRPDGTFETSWTAYYQEHVRKLEAEEQAERDARAKAAEAADKAPATA